MGKKCKVLILALVLIVRTQGIFGESQELEQERETSRSRDRETSRGRDLETSRSSDRDRERERAKERDRDRDSAPTKAALPALKSTPSVSVELGLNSSESVRHDLEYSSVSFEDDFPDRDRDRDLDRGRDPSAGAGERTNYWQFKKMPDAENNYQDGSGPSDDYDVSDATEHFGEATGPSIQNTEVRYPPAEDRFITRHSKRLTLPTYTTIYRNNRIIRHGPRRGKHGRRGRGHGPPPSHGHHHGHHHHQENHHHQDTHGSFQKFVPSYISFGPIQGHPPSVGSHSSMAPVYVPARGRGHGHGHGNHGSHSHHNPFTVTPSGGAPPLPPLLNNMHGGPPHHLGPPMAAIYIPPSPTPYIAPNRYPASLPYKDDDDEDKYYSNYYPPKSTPWKYSSSSKRPTPTYRSKPKNPYGSQSSSVYIPVPPGYNRNRNRHPNPASTSARPYYQSPSNSYSSSRPGQLYQKPEHSYMSPGKSAYGSPPMNFGQPMHNFGPPMSSYGKPPPIIGEMPTSIYEPTDEMYRYKNDPPTTQSTYGNNNGPFETNFPRNQYGGGATNFPSNQYAGGSGGSKTRYNDWDSTEAYGHGGSTELHETMAYPKSPIAEVRPPTRPYRPPPFYKNIPYENDNYNEYSSNSYQSTENLHPTPPTRRNRPPPNYDTRYNSPGLSMDPKIVDWMPYSTKDYRKLRNRHGRAKSDKNRRYSTLPDPIQSHRPDPDHENYPKLTYDALKKRVIALTAAGDLQTSSTNSE